MADKKISQLTAITAPIAGTDVLPIVQSSTTKKITVAQLVPGLGSFTAPSGNVKGLVWTDGTVLANDATVTDVGYDTSTNTVQAKNLTVASTATITNGNLVIGTSGKGIDFSATAGTGTSELFADYEEGTWTATLLDGVTTITTLTGLYTKIGRLVSVEIGATATYNGTGLVGAFTITGLPYTVASTSVGTSLVGARNGSVAVRAEAYPGGTTIYFYTTTSETQATTNQLLTSANQTQRVFFQLTYSV